MEQELSKSILYTLTHRERSSESDARAYSLMIVDELVDAYLENKEYPNKYTSDIIDNLIKYFIVSEEFEKCNKLKEIKTILKL